jgi:hypothetical protein
VIDTAVTAEEGFSVFDCGDCVNWKSGVSLFRNGMGLTLELFTSLVYIFTILVLSGSW